MSGGSSRRRTASIALLTAFVVAAIAVNVFARTDQTQTRPGEAFRAAPNAVSYFGFNESFQAKIPLYDYTARESFAAAVAAVLADRHLAAATLDLDQARRAFARARARLDQVRSKPRAPRKSNRAKRRRAAIKREKYRLRRAGAKLREARSDYDKARYVSAVRRAAANDWSDRWQKIQRDADNELRRRFAYQSLSHSNVARISLLWSDVEPRQGEWDWDWYDKVYRAALAAGSRPLFTVLAAPCWTRPDTPCKQGSYRPDNNHLIFYARFLQQAARRYPQALGFEVWNEPNMNRFWGDDYSTTNFLKMAEVADGAVHGVNPAFKVIGPSLAPINDWQSYYRRLLRNGLASHVDALAVHVYPKQAPVTREALAQFDEMVAIRNEFPPPRDPLWVTETGLSTAAESVIGDKAVTVPQQATRLVEIHDGLVARGAQMMIVHRIFDGDYGDPWENRLGVVKADGSYKPAFCALGELRGPKPFGC